MTTGNPLAAPLTRLLNDLQAVSEEHDEVTDTDVREVIHRTVNHYVVWGNDPTRFPRTFKMFSAEADALVSEAVRRFVLEARNMVGSVALGAPRLALVQDRAVEGAAGRHYDEFMGHRDTPLASGDLPEAYFQPGEYDEE